MDEKGYEPVEGGFARSGGLVDGLQLVLGEYPFPRGSYWRLGDRRHWARGQEVLAYAPLEEGAADSVGVLLLAGTVVEAVEPADNLAWRDVADALTAKGEMGCEVAAIELDCEGSKPCFTLFEEGVSCVVVGVIGRAHF